MRGMRKKSPSLELAKSVLSKNRKATYQEVKQAAEKKKIPMIPVIYGRAKLSLGIVKAGASKRYQPRVVTTRRRRTKTSLDLKGIIAQLETAQQYEEAIVQIRAILDALS